MKTLRRRPEVEWSQAGKGRMLLPARMKGDVTPDTTHGGRRPDVHTARRVGEEPGSPEQSHLIAGGAAHRLTAHRPGRLSQEMVGGLIVGNMKPNPVGALCPFRQKVQDNQ